MADFDLFLTKYGFRWGPFRIERVASDPRFGVVVWVGSDTEQYQVRVSPKGRKVEVRKCDECFWYEQEATGKGTS